MIVTVTINPALDKLVRAPRVCPRTKLRCKPPRHAAGGGGVNVARALLRLGGDALAVWASSGPTGERYRELLERENVEGRALRHTPVGVRGEVRENIIVVDEETSENYRFGMPGPTLEAADERAVLEAVDEAGGEVVVASGSLPPGVEPDFYGRLGERARVAGRRFVLDAHGEALRLGLAARPFLIKPNRDELSGLVDRSVGTEAELETAAQELREGHGVEFAAVSLGAEGLLIAGPEGLQRVASPRVDVRSTVGAGDSTLAGLLLGLERGWPAGRAARFGAAAGAAAVSTPGFELCERGLTERLFAELES